MTVFEASLGPCWTHHKAHLNRFGVEELTLETLSPVASKVALLSLQSILSPKPCGALQKCHLNGPMLAQLGAMLGPILGLCWGPFHWVYVGAMFAHLGAMLGLCWGHVRLGAMLELCWPPGGDFGAMLFSWVHLHSQILLESSPQRPARHPLHFCNAISLRKLNPAWDGHTPDERLKAPTSGLRGSRQGAPPPVPKLRFAYATAQPDCMGFAQQWPGHAGTRNGQRKVEKKNFLFLCYFFWFLSYLRLFSGFLHFLGRGLPRKRHPGDPGDASDSFDFPIGSAAPGVRPCRAA